MNLVFDTETTGLVKHPNSKDEVQPRIIEWAGCVCDASGHIVREQVWLINPGCEISEEITNITGIDNAMVKDAPRFTKVVDQIEAFIYEAGGVNQTIAHNVNFDISMMGLEYARLKRALPQMGRLLCTVEENQPFYGFRPPLTLIYEDLMGHPLAQTHRALDDVHALVEVCKRNGVLI